MAEDSDGWMERAIREHAPSCQWVLGADGIFRDAHGNTAPLFGKSAAHIPGRAIVDLFDDEPAEKWIGWSRRAIAGETFVLRTRSGDAFYCVTWFPLAAPSGEVYAAGCAQDITPISTAEAELRETTLRMLKAQESERGRLARFLHDEVGQSLSAAGLHLDLLRMDYEAAVPEIRGRTAELQRMLETVMAGVREYSYELNPDIVERAGLHAAMDRLVGRMRKEFSGNLRLMSDTSLRFPPAVGSALYKIAAEALENALEHAACSQIEVIIKSSPDGLTLEVRDNGTGFDAADPAQSHRGLGLLVMEHYAGQVGLNLSVRSETGKGTTVRAVYPLPAEESRG